MDTIANFLSKLKNASILKKDSIELPHSKLIEEILKVLKANSFIRDYKVFKFKDTPFKGIHVDLDYVLGKPRILEARRVSRPGRRIYRSFDSLKMVRNGFGLSIVSTSSGLMSVKEAKKRHLGGEVLCEIY